MFCHKLGDLLSLTVCLSCPPPSSPYVLGSPLVGLLTGAFRSLCSALCRFFCLLVLLFWLVFVGDPRHMASSLFFFLSAFFSLSSVPCCCLGSVRLSFVLFFCGDASCCFVSFLFLLVLPCALCICLWWVCVGGSLFSFVTACLTCVSHVDRCPRSMQCLCVDLFFVPSSCLVACRRSVWLCRFR